MDTGAGPTRGRFRARPDARVRQVTDEDLIESVPRPPSAVRRKADALLHHPAGAIGLLVLGLVAGSLGGFAVGHSNPRSLAGPGYVYLPFAGFDPGLFGLDQSGAGSADPNFGREPLPTLTADDLAGLGEQVGRELSILSAQSAIPILCNTGIGQPGSTTLGYPSSVFGLDDGSVAELIWSHADAAAASRALHTLVFQAQLCPDLPELNATVRSSGVLNGLGDEYVIFSREPTAASGADAVFATIVLVRVDADLIEIGFTSELVQASDAEARCLQIAATAVARALGQ